MERRQIAALITALTRSSGHFSDLWEQPDAHHHTGQRKTIHHTAVGDLTLDCDVLTADDADLKLVVFTAAATTEDAQKLAVLNVIGLQVFAEDE